MPQSLSMNLVHLFNSMDGMFGVDGCGALTGLFRIARRSSRAMPWAAMWLPPLGRRVTTRVARIEASPRGEKCGLDET